LALRTFENFLSGVLKTLVHALKHSAPRLTGIKRCNTPSGKQSTTDFPAGQRGRLVSRRKMVTEITIETNQVLVIQRRQVTRSWCSEGGREAELVRLEEVNALVDETGNQRCAEASSSSPRSTTAADGSRVIYLQSLLGATTLAKRFINCLRRRGKRKSETQE
jgi:hypothetical protein